MYRNENMGDSTQGKNQTKRLSRSHHNEENTRHYVKDEGGGGGPTTSRKRAHRHVYIPSLCSYSMHRERWWKSLGNHLTLTLFEYKRNRKKDMPTCFEVVSKYPQVVSGWWDISSMFDHTSNYMTFSTRYFMDS